MVDDNQQPISPDRAMRAGERLYQKMPGITEPAVNADIRLLHEDEAVIVLEKPAPLPMHACGRFNRNTLQHLMHLAYAPQKPRACHRLDANTSGLVVLARTRHFARQVQAQFAEGRVEKIYVARVLGHPSWDECCCELPIASEASDLGAREVDETAGDEARTEFKVLSRDLDGTTRIEARPITGRTNQIRVHLWQLGHPIVGDPAYLPGGLLGDTQTLRVDAPPMCLHAAQLSFTHPMQGERLTFTSAAPF
jgi:RluA family pseudouridine synthase